jgi:hypothetical protein
MKPYFHPSYVILLPSLVDEEKVIDGERRVVANGGEDKLSKESLRGTGLRAAESAHIKLHDHV